MIMLNYFIRLPSNNAVNNSNQVSYLHSFSGAGLLQLFVEVMLDLISEASRLQCASSERLSQHKKEKLND